MSITEFLLARIAEDHEKALKLLAGAQRASLTLEEPKLLGTTQVGWHLWRDVEALAHKALIECAAKRRIIEWHQNWPVLVEQQPQWQRASDSISETTFHITRQIAWMTEAEYRKRFGSEPPTGPILRAMAEVYADHPDYEEGWE